MMAETFKYGAWLQRPTDRLRSIVTYDRHGQLERFTVQYETLLGDDFAVVTRYDTAHGGPHQDIYDRDGRQLEKKPVPFVGLDDALQYAEADIRRFWRVYRERF
jgi:hypothetical protein